MSDLVSVIIPAHNAGRFLEATLDSALRQTHGALEVIVINDGSSDDTLGIANRAAALHRRVRVLNLRSNGGPARARNAGIEAARGRYIAFLDSDDLWMPEKIARQLSLLDSTHAALCYTGYRTMDEAGNRSSSVGHAPATVTYAELLRGNVIPCSSAIYDTRRLGKVYMPDIRKRQDYGLWLKILKAVDGRRGPAAVGIDEPLILYRMRSGSVSSNKLSAARYQWRIYRELERLPLWRSLYCFTHYAFHGVLKYQRHS